MMRWRLFLACLLMAAIPLQGFAASTMLLCVSGAAQQLTPVHEPSAPPAHAGHAHKDGTGHSAHAKGGAHAPDMSDSATVHGLDHKCSLCAACCHHLALAEWPQWVPLAGLPQAQAREPFVFVLAPPTQLPDKPPRA